MTIDYSRPTIGRPYTQPLHLPAIDYTHPRRSSTRTVPAGQPITLQPGESVVLGSRTVTRSAR